MKNQLKNLNMSELVALDTAHHFHPFTDHKTFHAGGGARIITHADGVWIWDAAGNRMLDAMSPPESTATATAATSPPAAPEPTSTAASGPETDLVGTWQAKAGDASIDLMIGEDSQFTWKATQPGKPAIELTGELTASNDMLVLSNKDQGDMVGRVKSDGPDKWQFAMAGGAPNDPGLTFSRVKR